MQSTLNCLCLRKLRHRLHIQFASVSCNTKLTSSVFIIYISSLETRLCPSVFNTYLIFQKTSKACSVCSYCRICNMLSIYLTAPSISLVNYFTITTTLNSLVSQVQRHHSSRTLVWCVYRWALYILKVLLYTSCGPLMALECSFCSVSELVMSLLKRPDYTFCLEPVSRAVFAFKWQSGNGFCWSKEDARLGNTMVEGRQLLIFEFTTLTNRGEDRTVS